MNKPAGRIHNLRKIFLDDRIDYHSAVPVRIPVFFVQLMVVLLDPHNPDGIFYPVFLYADDEVSPVSV